MKNLGKKIDARFFSALPLISLFLSVSYNLLSKRGIQFIREKEEFEFITYGEDIGYDDNLSGKLKLIDISLAYDLYSNKSALFIDARDKWDFAEGHIEGAENIPEHSLDFNPDRLDRLDKDLTYIIYCGDNDCETSRRLGMRFIEEGFGQVLVFEGGWTEWEANQYPRGIIDE